MPRPWLLACTVAVVLLVGCDESKPQSKGTTTTVLRDAPGPQPANPATQPASRPSHSTLMIGGREFSFPPARILLQETQPRIDLLLFSDDPRTALGPRYSGNRYYLPLHGVEVDNLTQLDAAEWLHKAPSSVHRDIPDGIFLKGDTEQLQPFDVRVAFALHGNELTVSIEGNFLLFQARNPGAGPQLVPVQGVVTAEIEGLDQGRKGQGGR